MYISIYILAIVFVPPLFFLQPAIIDPLSLNMFYQDTHVILSQEISMICSYNTKRGPPNSKHQEDFLNIRMYLVLEQ